MLLSYTFFCFQFLLYLLWTATSRVTSSKCSTCHPSTNLPFPMLHTISSLGPFLLQWRQRQQILVIIFSLSEEHSLNIQCHENLSFKVYTHGTLSFKFFIQNPVSLNLNGTKMIQNLKLTDTYFFFLAQKCTRSYVHCATTKCIIH